MLLRLLIILNIVQVFILRRLLRHWDACGRWWRISALKLNCVMIVILLHFIFVFDRYRRRLTDICGGDNWIVADLCYGYASRGVGIGCALLVIVISII